MPGQTSMITPSTMPTTAVATMEERIALMAAPRLEAGA